MKVLVNYANTKYREAQKINSNTALEVGGLDRVMSYGPMNIDVRFMYKNIDILKEYRGSGYWLWKPYFILKSLHKIADGDYLLYADSGGIQFVRPIDPLIELMHSYGQTVLPFALKNNVYLYLRKQYTKRDTFILMGMDDFDFPDEFQIMAGCILFQKSQFAVNFVAEWLHYAQDERILTDIPNQMGKPNYPEFIDHRHDQSILDLLSVKHGLTSSAKPPEGGPELFTQGGLTAVSQNPCEGILARKRTYNVPPSGLTTRAISFVEHCHRYFFKRLKYIYNSWKRR